MSPSGKLTWLAGKWTWIEDVFPVENGGFMEGKGSGSRNFKEKS